MIERIASHFVTHDSAPSPSAGITPQAPDSEKLPSDCVDLDGSRSRRTSEPVTVEGSADRSGGDSLPPMGQVFMKSSTETLSGIDSTDYQFVLHKGKIFMKGIGAEKWEMVGKTGLPESPDHRHFNVPDDVVEISADRKNIVALSSNGTLYKGNFKREDGSLSIEWKDKFGFPAKHTVIPRNSFLSISNRVKNSSVIDPVTGRNVFNEVVGVTTLYYKGRDNVIYYGDPWIKGVTSKVFGPQRGRFDIASMDASGSLIFVMDRKGSMYTRSYDFDLGGRDNLYEYAGMYTFDTDRDHGYPLPFQDEWVPQPPIDGQITGKICVVQTTDEQNPVSNTMLRELRVLGCKDGQTGYFHKSLSGREWSFKETPGVEIKEPFLQKPAAGEVSPDLLPSFDADYRGAVTFKSQGDRAFDAELKDFNIDNSPSKLKIRLDADHTLDLTMHIRHFYLKDQIVATLELPDSALASEDPMMKRIVDEDFGGEKFAHLQVEDRKDRYVIHNRHWDVAGPIKVPNFARTIKMSFPKSTAEKD